MSDAEVWTVGRLLQWTTDFLKQKDSPSPRLDAEILLATARNCQRIELYTAYDQVPLESQRQHFRELVRRRALGEPVAYLVGQREFFSLRFHVTPDVLIPRPETEFVMVALLDAIQELGRRNQPWRIADIGTGSGVLAVCCARNIPGCQVVAVDKSPAALAVARTNVELHKAGAQVTLLVSDLFRELPEQQFDFVVSNPPYVAEAEMAQLPREVVGYEPHLALRGGPQGTEVIERLIDEAAPRLCSPGALIFEISPMIEERVHALVVNHGSYAPPRTIKDLAGLARVVVAWRC